MFCSMCDSCQTFPLLFSVVIFFLLSQNADWYQTLVSTAKKLGVNFFHYLRDRIGGTRKMPSLADLIQQRANDLQLGSSWESS